MSIISLFRAAFSQPKNVLDDFRPAVAHPETAADWKENCNCWLAYWLTPVFKSVLKLEQDEPHSSASLRRSNFRQTGARMQLDEILETITTTLRDLSIVLELYGSASILSPHISVVWPFVRAKLRLRYRTSNDYTSLDLMEDLVRRWQTEARAAMTEVLSTQEEGRALLRTFRWQPESI